MKYLGIYLPKEAKVLYSENCKTLMKEIKDNANSWKIYYVLGLEESILWKWLYYLRQPKDSIQSLSNYQVHFFTELEQKAYILYGNTKDFK